MNDSRTIRFQAARVLSQMEPPRDTGVAVLMEALKEKPQRLEAALALVRIGPPAVPALVTALKDPSPALRRDAAEILRDLGPKAKSAVGALSAALKDEQRAVRGLAARAL